MKNLLQAAAFAAQKHAKQRRMSSAREPYINHPIEVAEHLAKVGGVKDEHMLMAALLHDTIEDTDTTAEEIREAFGEAVLELVLECTDDKSLEKMERKRLQIVNAPFKSPGAKLIKIADKTCNLRGILIDPPKPWSVQRQLEYFLWAKQVVAGLLGENPRLDDVIVELLDRGISELEARVEQDD
jgi:GTP diphosphokinase / guanosine-3',5'-bis(diphosphate) 3'-diphosphatase